MRRRTWMQAGLGWGVAGCFSALAGTRLQWKTITFNGFGTTLSIRAAHATGDQLHAALQEARRVVEEVEAQMSLFRPDSAIHTLNREGVLLHPSRKLLGVLQISQHMARHSQGAFDVTVQPLWSLYAAAQKEKRLPTEQEVFAARQKVGWENLHVSAQKVMFARPGMGITLNGIAQGFACDLVREELRQRGVMHALINTGEWSSLGRAEAQRDWSLGIADPHQSDRLIAQLQMKGLCVATSADDQCTFSSDHKHHHILDPHTGYSPPDIASVTVAAHSCARADALTKVLFVAGYERALQLATAWKVQAFVVHKDGRSQATPAMQVRIGVT
jgi:thiamine biosynthesis lipoprotein